VVKRLLNIEIDQENDRSLENKQHMVRTAKAQEKRVSISGFLGFGTTKTDGQLVDTAKYGSHRENDFLSKTWSTQGKDS
jgi:hypothetical protein